jgi:nitrogen regulatory protein P-II 1
MKRVEAIISPLHLEAIKDRLRMVGVPGMTIQAVRIPGDAQTVIYRGLAPVTDLSDRIRLDVVVIDDMVDTVTRAIIQVVGRVEPGDGIIFIAPVDEAIRIRTGEAGSDAL